MAAAKREGVSFEAIRRAWERIDEDEHPFKPTIHWRNWDEIREAFGVTEREMERRFVKSCPMPRRMKP